MTWTVDYIYSLLKFLIRKNQAGGISPSNFFFAWNTEQNMYHNDIVGRWQNRNNSKEGANTGLVLNETVLSDLSPFTLSEILPVTSGIVYKPSDFIFKLSMRINDSKVYIINPGQLPYIIDSVIDAPSTTDSMYYGVQYEDYYKIYPNSVTSLVMDYVAAPEDVKWGYTFDAEGREVYNPGASVQPKWSTPTIITITKRALTSLGVSFKDADFMNFGRTAQATGN